MIWIIIIAVFVVGVLCGIVLQYIAVHWGLRQEGYDLVFHGKRPVGDGRWQVLKR